MVKNILVDNRKTRILPDIEFVMKNQELKELLFCVVFRKIKWQHFQEMQISYFGLFLSKFGQKWIFHKNWAPSLLFPEHSPRKNHTQTCDILYFRKKKQQTPLNIFPVWIVGVVPRVSLGTPEDIATACLNGTEDISPWSGALLVKFLEVKASGLA